MKNKLKAHHRMNTLTETPSCSEELFPACENVGFSCLPGPPQSDGKKVKMFSCSLFPSSALNKQVLTSSGCIPVRYMTPAVYSL